MDRGIEVEREKRIGVEKYRGRDRERVKQLWQ